MAFVNTYNKWEAARAFINTWLKDKSIYCNYCGLPYNPKDVTEEGHWIKCCEDPQIGRNIDHTIGVIKQNKELRKIQNNSTASTKSKAMRYALSMPPSLYRALNDYFLKMYKQKIFDNTKELRTFMKEFPAFCIPERT